MSCSLLKVQIGPVQDFIAQARSTRDLWSGSYLLSWLMAAGARALVEELAGQYHESTDDARKHVVSPNLGGQPLLELHLAGPQRGKETNTSPLNDERLTPNFTNILIARLPANSPEAARVAQAVETAIRGEWINITKACWKHCAAIGLQGRELEERWDAQITHFPSIAWHVTPAFSNVEEAKATSSALLLHAEAAAALQEATDTYAAQAAMNSWQLDAVRQLRDFRAWGAGDARLSCEKDSLTGREEVVLGGKVVDSPPHHSARTTQAKDWWARHVETKGEGSPWWWLFRERQRTEHYGALSVVKRVWHWAYLKEQWNLEAMHCREPDGKEFPFPSTFHIACHDPAKNESVSRLPSEESDRAERYFAVLALDGDEMGKWLSGENSGRALTEAYHTDLSRRLSQFALHCVRPIVEACDGRLILAGGEDVLALLPADCAVACARFLRAAYRADASFIGTPRTAATPGAGLAGLAGILLARHKARGRAETWYGEEASRMISPWLSKAARGELYAPGSGHDEMLHWGLTGWYPDATPPERGQPLSLALPGGLRGKVGQRPDVSAGVAVAHFKEPLQDVVQAALAAEKRAKHDLGRGALAVTLVKHSGETVKWGCKWESGGLELLDVLQRGRGEAVLSSRFPHRLVEVLSPYLVTREAGGPAVLEEPAGFGDKVDDIIEREFAVVLDRQKGTAKEAVRNAFHMAKETHLPGHLRCFLEHLSRTEADAQTKLRAVIGLSQVAAFIEPAVYSETFTRPESPAQPLP